MAITRYRYDDPRANFPSFIKALFALKTAPGPGDVGNLYDWYVQRHSYFAWNTHAHGANSFLPWHRRFLMEFEADLRTHNPDKSVEVSIPYWDWYVDPMGAELFTVDSFGPAVEPEENGKGFFDENVWPINVGVVSGRRLTRRLNKMPELMKRSGANYTRYREALEINPHDEIHMAFKGQMMTAASPNDPTFWLHHAQLDKLWAEWQVMNGIDNYPERDGDNLGPGDIMKPFDVEVSSVFDIRHLTLSQPDDASVAYAAKL
ncbi:hypothetical protein GCM10010124_29750 [Pilimelia terevasa]|uniref:Tyrosinase copper-binding domain-containing protein n=1 Tax=Pilimelia terevasa TaxID=53372 RepID=A0A8J3FJ51_9ACTN|nr:tyrosinase family protein [Pilimelia terevasa]GGK35116.1 hypothetical protein GCM10010124_29750 [Pilimelia terevasa]